jgi:hypothetical protein
MRSALGTLGLAALVVVGLAKPAAAAPITLSYQVLVDQRFSYVTNAWATIDPIAFVLSVTFDDQISSAFSNSTYDSTRFGEPTFSGMPDFGGPGPTTGTATAISEQFRNPVTGFSGAYVYTEFAQTGFPNFASNGVELSNITPGLTTGAMNLASFLELLDAPSLTFSQWSYSHTADGFAPDSYNLQGTATRIDPVAEPGTVMLLGSGLALLLVRARRRA